MNTSKNRLPRKRKKYLKKFGGLEYYIQVPRKNVGEATIKDFEDIMKKYEKDFKWPVYDDFGGVMVTGKDSSGVTWVLHTSAQNFHDAMAKEAKKQFGDGKA